MGINIWEQKGHKVIPTNGKLKSNGLAVMGAGLAKQAALRNPNLPARLGRQLKYAGNHVWSFYFCDNEEYIYTFPTKEDWKDPSNLCLIEKSAKQLAFYLEELWDYSDDKVYMPRVGCGLGGLSWGDVKPILLKYLGTYIARGQLIFTEP